jgi:hypothetical protein
MLIRPAAPSTCDQLAGFDLVCRIRYSNNGRNPVLPRYYCPMESLSHPSP